MKFTNILWFEGHACDGNSSCIVFLHQQEAWRKPCGIGNPVRRRMRGNRPMPSIGHGTDKRRKHVLQSGFKKVFINNVRVSFGRT